MWGTDLTTTFTGEGPAAVFVAVDHCSVECVGVHAHSRASRFEALEPIRQGVRRHFGGFAKVIALGLSVRHERVNSLSLISPAAISKFLWCTEPRPQT